MGNAVMFTQGSADGVAQPAPAQAPTPPVAPTPTVEAPIAVGSEMPAPGVITIQRGGKTITINGAPGAGGPGDIGSETGFPPGPFPSDIPPGVQSLASTAIIGFCLMIAAYPVFGFLKALVNRSAARQSALPPRDTTDRLQRIEQAVEAMSVEVERISEGQRFVTRVLSERSSAQT